MPSSRSALVAAAGIAVIGSLSACSKDNSSSVNSSSVNVTASDDACHLSDTTISAGASTFTVRNTGSNVTEVYVYGKDGADFTAIVGEAENIGPGTTRSFDVTLSTGRYQVACKPGMSGHGIRTMLTVAGKATVAGATHRPTRVSTGSRLPGLRC